MSQKELQRVTVIAQCVRREPGVRQGRGAARAIASAYQTAQSPLSARQRSGSGSRQPRTPQPSPHCPIAFAKPILAFGSLPLRRLQRSSSPRQARRTRRLLGSAAKPFAASCGPPASARPANAALPLIASVVCARPAKENSCSSTALLTTGSKAVALASPLWACRMMLPAKSSPLSSSSRKPPKAISTCSRASCAASVSPWPSTAIAAAYSSATMNTGRCEEQLAGQRQPTQFGRALASARHHLHRCTNSSGQRPHRAPLGPAAGPLVQ